MKPILVRLFHPQFNKAKDNDSTLFVCKTEVPFEFSMQITESQKSQKNFGESPMGKYFRTSFLHTKRKKALLRLVLSLSPWDEIVKIRSLTSDS